MMTIIKDMLSEILSVSKYLVIIETKLEKLGTSVKFIENRNSVNN